MSATDERISSGLAPYSVDVSSQGGLAVVSDVGLAGLAPSGRLCADSDTATLIDVSRRPFRAVQFLTVPSVPEGAAISPDGHWVVVQSMDGSNLPSGRPGHHAQGRIVLFEIRHGRAAEVDEAPTGAAAQGIVFTADNRYVLAQWNVEREIAVYLIDGKHLRDTGRRLHFAAGPASIRTMPR